MPGENGGLNRGRGKEIVLQEGINWLRQRPYPIYLVENSKYGLADEIQIGKKGARVDESNQTERVKPAG